MQVLVISASKHGSTREIASAIAEVLREKDISVDLKQIDEPVSVTDYDAVVLGSAVYIGHWMPEALKFVEKNQQALFERPVWLFSSGPLGEDNGKAVDKKQIDKLMADTVARDHKLFAGALFGEELGLKEKVAIKVVHAQYGDFRDWDAIRAWARDIGEGLQIAGLAPKSA